MSHSRVTCMCVCDDNDPVPLFLGREDGSMEKYTYVQDVDLGRPSLRLHGHTEAVTAVSAVSADEVYSCSLDATIKLWNTSDGFDAGANDESERTHAYHTSLNSVRISTSSPHKAHTSLPHKHRPPSRALRTITLPSPIHCLAVRDTRLYAGGHDGALYVIDGSRISIWMGHYDRISCIALSEDGLIVTGSYDNQLRVWDAMSGRCVRLLQGHANFVKGVVVMPVPENGLPEYDEEAEAEADEEDEADDAESDEMKNGYGGSDTHADKRGMLDEPEEQNQVILSISLDATVKLWVLPSQATLQAEMERADNEAAALQMQWAESHADRTMTVSFQLADTDAEEETEAVPPTVAETAGDAINSESASARHVSEVGEEKDGMSGSVERTDTTRQPANNNNNNNHTHATPSSAPGTTSPAASELTHTRNSLNVHEPQAGKDSSVRQSPSLSSAHLSATSDTTHVSETDPEATSSHPRLSFMTDTAKSALKHKRIGYARRLTARATLELPHIPYCICEAAEPSALLYLGGSRGELSCLHRRKLVRVVLRQTQRTRRGAVKAMQAARRQLRRRTAELRTRCARALVREERRVLQRVRQEQRKEAEKERQKQRQRPRHRRSLREDEDEYEHNDGEGENDDGYDRYEKDEEDNENEDFVELASVPDGDSENDVLGSENDSMDTSAALLEECMESYHRGRGGAASRQANHTYGHDDRAALARERRWQILGPEQRAALEAFVQTRWEVCDKAIAAAKSRTEAHVSELRPLATMNYVRTHEVFDQLPYAWRMVHGKEAVHAVVQSHAGLYVAQEGGVTRAVMEVGVTRL